MLRRWRQPEKARLKINNKKQDLFKIVGV